METVYPWTWCDLMGANEIFLEYNSKSELTKEHIIEFIKNNSSVCSSILKEITEECIEYSFTHNIQSLENKIRKTLPYCSLDHLYNFTNEIALSDVYNQICFPNYRLAITFKNVNQ
jgi:hypothetical protein